MDDTNPEWNGRKKAQKAQESGFLCLLRFFAAIWIVSYPADSCVWLSPPSPRPVRAAPLEALRIPVCRTPPKRGSARPFLACAATAQFARRLRRSLTERRNRGTRGIPSLAGFHSAYSACSAVITRVGALPLCVLRASALSLPHRTGPPAPPAASITLPTLHTPVSASPPRFSAPLLHHSCLT